MTRRLSRVKGSAHEARVTVGYVRVSTDDQATKGVSLDAQVAKVRAYCSAMDFGEPEIVSDAGASAKSLRRPGISTVLERVRRGEIERVVVAKLDRLTRSVRDLADLIELCAKHDVAIVSIGETLDTSSAGGRLVVNMLATVAQWEREVIAERTVDALAKKRRDGKAYCGQVPFGYRRDGDRFVPDRKEQLALHTMQRMDRNGASLRKIGAYLTGQGIRPRRSSVWHAASVRAVLRSRIASSEMVV